MNKFNKWGQSRHWEEACVKTRRSIEDRVRRLSYFKIKKKERVLDLGCGDGLNLKYLSTKGCTNLVGIDISPDLLKLAKKNTPKATFKLATAENLPFKNSKFDVVLVDSVFHHFMKYDKALSEIMRVLSPGGRLCFIEPHKSLARTIYDFVTELEISKYIPKLKERRESYLGEIKFMKHWLLTEAVFYKNLEKLGFIEILKKRDIMSIIGVYEKPID